MRPIVGSFAFKNILAAAPVKRQIARIDYAFSLKGAVTAIQHEKLRETIQAC